MEIYEDAIATFRSGATDRAEDFAAFSIVQSRQTAREMAAGRGARVAARHRSASSMASSTVAKKPKASRVSS
jgi:hypothetical protein